jgi:hypothetical protein
MAKSTWRSGRQRRRVDNKAKEEVVKKMKNEFEEQKKNKKNKEKRKQRKNTT